MFTITIDTPSQLAQRGIMDTNRLRRLDGMTVPGDTLGAIRALDEAWGATSGSVFTIDRAGYVECGRLLVGRLVKATDDDLSVEYATTGSRPGRLVFLGVGRR